MTSDITPEKVAARIEAFRATLHELQREMEPLVEAYEKFPPIHGKTQEQLFKSLGMVWSAWWDITEIVSFLRAADRRLRDEDGILADAEKER